AAEPPVMAVPAPDPPEVAAEAAEPPEEAVPFPDPTELAAYAAEPPEATSFTTALVMIVVPIHECSSCPVPASCERPVPHVTVMEAVYEPSAHPVTAKEAACELLPGPEPAEEAISEPSSCPGPTSESNCEL
ncbi:hypothetical protein M9458_005317, partial [Cirrhinus mrigala]